MSVAEVSAAAAVGLALGRWVNLSITKLPPPHPAADAATSSMASRPPVSIVDLMPLLSFAGPWRASSGVSRWLRCRPLLVDLITALTWAAIAYRYGVNLGAALLALHSLVFIHVVFVDLEHSLILNLVVLPALLVSVAAFPFTPLGQGWDTGEAYLRSLAGAGLGFVVMLVVYGASLGRGLGIGDLKLAAFLGGVLGFPLIVAGLMIAFMAGGLVALALLALRLRRLKGAMPYGPALVAGATVALLAGRGIWDWYFALFR